MSKVKDALAKVARKVKKDEDVSQAMTSAEGTVAKFVPGLWDKIRQAAAEGIVLLENDNTLPLTGRRKVALFGRHSVDMFYVGYGSGGDLHPDHKVSLRDAIREEESLVLDEELAAVYDEWRSDKKHAVGTYSWGKWPMSYEEMPLVDEFVAKVAERNDTAIVTIGRAAGEDRENELSDGSYYLTKVEKNMLDTVTEHFKNVIVVINSGNVIDMSWVRDYGKKLSAVLMVWQGGMEMGHAICDVLVGRCNPSGRLTDTIACKYKDYPSSKSFGEKEHTDYAEDIYVGYRYFETFAKDKVLYPFGYGKSYTRFEMAVTRFAFANSMVSLDVTVTNRGDCYGREVVQVYLTAPCGKLGKPEKSLIAFAKTGYIAPGASETISLVAGSDALWSYDDTGATGNIHCFVMEAGEYKVSVGPNCRDTMFAGGFSVAQTIVMKKVREALMVKNSFKRIKAVQGKKGIEKEEELVPLGQADLKERILSEMPQDVPFDSVNKFSFEQVRSGEVSKAAFLASLDNKELCALTRGQGVMPSPFGIPGNTGILGGSSKSLRDRDVPAVVTCDGPAGARINGQSSLIPCGTGLACTWDVYLVQELFTLLSQETLSLGIDVMLSPGLNIHRNPLCGRNFEYFSEDPVVAGKIAAAAVRGLQSQGKSACPKHFACNNQETKRNTNDSRVSNRALREIYLKGFEIVVREAAPKAIMTCYNKINGVWGHYNYDLVQTVLRREWGYDGLVMTDWWMQHDVSPEFANIRDNAYRVRASVDVVMPGDFDRSPKDYVDDPNFTESMDQPEGLTRGELCRCGEKVLDFIFSVGR